MPSKKNIQLFAHSEARRLFASSDRDVLIGAGYDDVALISIGTERLIITSDSTNFKRIVETFSEPDFCELGRYTVRQNVCDILGSGGEPKWFMLNVVLTEQITHEDITNFFRSVAHECQRFGVTVVGGDTKQGLQNSISGTMIGHCLGPHWSIASARLGHDLFVSGPIGGVMASLCVLHGEADEAVRREAIAVLYNTDVPLDLLEGVRQLSPAIAATDISDGLGYSIKQFEQNSAVNFRVFIDDVPLHPLTKLASQLWSIDQKAFLYAFGGDFQFLFSVPKTISEFMVRLGAIKIGEAIEGRSELVHPVKGEVGEVLDFGHLDFELTPPVERFLAFSRALSWLD